MRTIFIRFISRPPVKRLQVHEKWENMTLHSLQWRPRISRHPHLLSRVLVRAVLLDPLPVDHHQLGLQRLWFQLLHFLWQIFRPATNNFAQENLIGEGSLGRVYRGEFHDGQVITDDLSDVWIVDITSWCLHDGRTDSRAEHRTHRLSFAILRFTSTFLST